jgi:hypothetical protein
MFDEPLTMHYYFNILVPKRADKRLNFAMTSVCGASHTEETRAGVDCLDHRSTKCPGGIQIPSGRDMRLWRAIIQWKILFDRVVDELIHESLVVDAG